MPADKTVPYYAYGHDYGNSTTTGVVLLENGQRQIVTLPSTTAPGSLVNLARIRSGAGKDFASPADSLKDGEHVLVLGGSERFVGKLAIEQALSASTHKGDLSRYWSSHSLELLLTVASSMIEARAFGLYVVTGLPTETYNRANVMQVKRALQGVHDFTFDGQPRTAFIQVLQIVMEGMGALVSSRNTSMIRKAIIDIGGRTTDLVVFDGSEPITHLTRGRPVGVEEIAQKLSDSFEAVYDRPLSFAERIDILYAHAGILRHLAEQDKLAPKMSFEQRRGVLLSHLEDIPYPRIFAGNYANPVDLLGWMEKSLQDVGQEICSFIAQTWSSSERGKVAADIPIVELIGGGAYYLDLHVQALIPHLTVPREPEQANALGYADLAWELARVLHERAATA